MEEFWKELLELRVLKVVREKPRKDLEKNSVQFSEISEGRTPEKASDGISRKMERQTPVNIPKTILGRIPERLFGRTLLALEKYRVEF